MKDPEFVSGSAPFTIRGETFRTCYRTVGDIKSRRPLLGLHGGPGVPSNYMEPFGQLIKYGIPVILYDQFGCGESQPTDPTDLQRVEKISAKGDLWVPQLFMDEIDNLAKHLGIADDFDLLGHSWGGMLASQYIIERRPKGVKHLIIADSPASIPDWIKASREVIEPDKFGFPRTHRNAMKFAEQHSDLEQALTPDELNELREKGVNLDSQEYQDAEFEFMKYFDLRVQPWPDSWNKSLEGTGKSPVNKIMWGTAWTQPSGVLASWSVKDQVHTISVPTLVYNGKYEQAQDFVVEPFVKNIPNCKWVKFENSSHMPHYEEHDKCMELIKSFLIDLN